jgi:1,4-dihydroxy-2-naphthoate octaprenyltransferase
MPDWLRLALGGGVVACTHLSANLMNDYADSRSRADWKDLEYYGFFGGSKLIQTGELSERFYLIAAIVFAAIAAACLVTIAILLSTPWMIPLYVVVLLLGWSYSEKPFRLAYHALGEPVIFILFGIAPVMAGYYLQVGIFPSLKAFVLSLPFGLLTTAILVGNEVPDFSTDKEAGKRNWVVALGREKGYVVYSCLVAAAFLSIAAAVLLELLTLAGLAAFLFLPLGVKAARVLKRCGADKREAVAASKATIAMHSLVSIVLIAVAWLWPAR